jgi:type VI secretion system protein ImpK
MTPQFAQAIDPIMLHVLGLLERIARDEHPSPQDERLRIRGLLDQADAMLGAGQQWNLAKYALASWIDEMLVDAPWSGREWWSNNVLEVELFSSRECYDRFYILAKEASTLPQRDALEVFYVCVVLGFRGLYRDPEFSRSTIQALALPPDVDAWARQAAMSVRLGQGRPQLTGKRKDLAGAPPLRSRYVALWSGLALAMLLALSALLLFFVRASDGSRPRAAALPACDGGGPAASGAPHTDLSATGML